VLVAWTEDAWDEYVAWQVTDREMLRRISRLIEAIRRDPFRGEVLIREPIDPDRGA
jgi:toxin YoeB